MSSPSQHFSSLLGLWLLVYLSVTQLSNQWVEKLSEVTPIKRDGYKIRTNVWCFATVNSHVRATITSNLVEYVSWITKQRKKNLRILYKMKTDSIWESGQTEVGTCWKLTNSDSYIKEEWREFRPVSCYMFKVIRHKITGGSKTWNKCPFFTVSATHFLSFWLWESGVSSYKIFYLISIISSRHSYTWKCNDHGNEFIFGDLWEKKWWAFIGYFWRLHLCSPRFQRVKSPYFCYLSAACAAVGVEDPNKIPDDRITSSSYYLYYYPKMGRLHGSLGWCQKTNTITDDYIQVDMGAIRTVCAVATQGKKDGSFVKSYKLSFSVDEISWNVYQDQLIEKVWKSSTLIFSYLFNSVIFPNMGDDDMCDYL